MVNYKGVARLAAKEAKGYQLLIYETGGVIGMVGREWAYGAQVDMLQRTNSRELLAEVVRMLGRIPEEEAVSVRESGRIEQAVLLDAALQRMGEALAVPTIQEAKATPLMYGSTALWQTREKMIIGLPDDVQAVVAANEVLLTDEAGKVVRYDFDSETFIAQTLENADALWRALTSTRWVAWDD